MCNTTGPCRYRIRVKGQIDPEWTDWFLGLEIRPLSGGETMLTGWLPDQAALHGVLVRIRDLGLPLVGVEALDE